MTARITSICLGVPSGKASLRCARVVQPMPVSSRRMSDR